MRNRTGINLALFAACAVALHAQVSQGGGVGPTRSPQAPTVPQAQYPVSTRAGLITEVHGAVFLEGQLLTPTDKLTGQIQVQMKDRQLLRTEKGRAVVGLSPDCGADLELSSELRMDDSRLDQTQITILHGAMQISKGHLAAVPGTLPIRVNLAGGITEIDASSTTRFDAGTGRIWVSDGRVTVQVNGKTIPLKGGQMLGMENLVVSNFDPKSALLSQRWGSTMFATFSFLAGTIHIDADEFRTIGTTDMRAAHLRVEEGQTLRVVQGWAELETSGVTFRIATGTAIRLAQNEIVFERGALVGFLPYQIRESGYSTVPFRFGDCSLRFLQPGALFQFESQGLPQGLIRIYRGAALAEWHGATTKVPSSKVITLSSTKGLSIEKLDARKNPPFYAPPNAQGINVRAQSMADDPSLVPSGITVH